MVCPAIYGDWNDARDSNAVTAHQFVWLLVSFMYLVVGQYKVSGMMAMLTNTLQSWLWKDHLANC